MTSTMNGAAEAIEIFMNAAMAIERQAYLGVGHYVRHNERVSYANGVKAKHETAGGESYSHYFSSP